MRLLINLILAAVVIGLVWTLISSIQEPIAFKSEKERRERAVIERLMDVRTAQDLFRSIKGGFSPTFDSLKEVLTLDSFAVVKVTGDPDDPTFTGEILYDTILSPAIDSIIGLGINLDSLPYVPFGGGATFEIAADTITYQKTTVNVVEVGIPRRVFMGKYKDKRFAKYDQGYDPNKPLKFWQHECTEFVWQLGMIKFEIVEDTFAKTKAKELELSILAGVDSFTYMVVDKRRHIQVLKEYALEEGASLLRRQRAVQKIVKDDGMLQLSFGKMQLGLIGLQATILPERLYNPDKHKTYLEQLTNLSVSAEIVAEDLYHLSAKLVYALDPKTQVISRQFSNARKVHLYTAFLEALRPHAATQKGAHLFCHVRGAKNISLSI